MPPMHRRRKSLSNVGSDTPHTCDASDPACLDPTSLSENDPRADAALRDFQDGQRRREKKKAIFTRVA